MLRPIPTICTNLLLAGSCSFFLAACSSDSEDSSSGGPSGSACAQIGYGDTAKIVNGDRCPITSSDDSSSIAKLEIITGGSPSGVCTGTVISPTAILTAAHCFIGSDKAANVITTVNGSQRSVRSRSVSIHPGFTVSNSVMINDVAVIRTATRMSAPATPILLRRDAQDGEQSLVAGYGQTSASAPTTDDVYAGYAVVRSVTDNHIRIDFNSNESHPCRGDSGGALLLEDGGLAIAGVVSQSDPSIPADTICEVGDKTLYTSMQNASVSSFVLSVAPDAAVR